jgi:hypothetical protein
LRQIPLQQLGKAISASAVIVFFAISGLLAWIVVFARFMLALARNHQ